jgi:hypothetical protein
MWICQPSFWITLPSRRQADWGSSNAPRKSLLLGDGGPPDRYYARARKKFARRAARSCFPSATTVEEHTMRPVSWPAIVLGFFAFAALSSPTRAVAADLDVVFEDDFEKGMDNWQTTDPDPSESVWKVVPAETHSDDKENHVLRVTGMSKYQPPYRSPHSIAWLKDTKVGDFELTARVQNTNPSGGAHRDLCVFWGRQSPAEFYYVHFGAKADPHACQIFIVNNDKRTMITRDQALGTPWTEGWHDIKVVRRVADGTVEVFFDDMNKPLMTARDTTFGAGEIGLGTFDDSGNFDDVVLRAKRVAD